MYAIIRQVIANGGYKLAEMQQRIKRMYVQGDLAADQMDELLALTESGAAADAERPDTLAMLKRLSERVTALEEKLAGNASDGDGGAYPAWQPWDGLSSNYQPGAIVTHNGKLWRSAFAGQNVWEPGAVGEDFWVECAGEETEAV